MPSKLTICLFALIIIISTFITKFLNNLRTDFDFEDNDSSERQKRFSESITKDLIRIDDKLRHTIWFLQISDLHISDEYDSQRITDLEQFCSQYIDIIKPSVVLATGDLTHGSRPESHDNEWIMYWNVMNKTNMISRTNWLDIKGNHDVFHWNSQNNYFKRYSVRGPNNSRSYKFDLKHETETYSFIGVDACLESSTQRPCNFFGLLKQEEINHLKQLKESGINSNYTVWFGHFPTSSIAMPAPGLREIINGPYVCGHYHTIRGLVNQMYSSQPTGYLELEVADWKYLRAIRLAAIDHNLFTFIDFRLNEWPIILITNPKNSLYSMPKWEPLHRIANSTHIRVLVFSKSKISSVKFRIDDNQWYKMKSISDPLYVHEWHPNYYNNGMHWIEVTAVDFDHNNRTVKHQFSLDGSKPNFPFGARFMLRIHFRTIICFLFASAVSICVLPILSLRITKITNKGRYVTELAENNVFRRFVFKLYLLSNINKVMLPLIAIPLYAIIGPWFVVLDGHIGVCFIWPIFISDSYLPGVTYLRGSLLMLFFQMPITCCLSHIIYCRHKELASSHSYYGFVKTYCHIRHILFLVLIAFHIYISLSIFYFYFGLMAYILGFINTWSFLIYIILWRLSLRLNPNSFPDSIRPKYKRQKDWLQNSEQKNLKRRPIRD